MNTLQILGIILIFVSGTGGKILIDAYLISRGKWINHFWEACALATYIIILLLAVTQGWLLTTRLSIVFCGFHYLFFDYGLNIRRGLPLKYMPTKTDPRAETDILEEDVQNINPFYIKLVVFALCIIAAIYFVPIVNFLLFIFSWIAKPFIIFFSLILFKYA